jgi:cytochrome c biogenesis factor
MSQIEAVLPDSNVIFLESVMADQGMVALSIGKKGQEGGGETLLLEVSRKPLINVLWLGTIIIMVGLFLTTWRRSKEV